jgi:hypothetical protein
MLKLLSHPEDMARTSVRSAPDRSVTLELPIQLIVFVFEPEIDAAACSPRAQ